MKKLAPDLDYEAWIRVVKSAPDRTLMLDYDGTLAPFRLRRDEAVPYPGVRQRLERIISSERTRLVIVSGRAVDGLLPLLGLSETPEIWGSHGRERLMADGSRHVVPLEAEAQSGLDRAREWTRSEGLATHCEEKPGCLAVHLRGLKADEAENVKRLVNAAWSGIVADRALQIHEFDGGLEIRGVGIDKGRAVHEILEGHGGAVSNAYLGDDLTDEDAFEAIAGRGLAVLVRQEFRETKADLWIEPPGELLEFLDLWVRATGT